MKGKKLLQIVCCISTDTHFVAYVADHHFDLLEDW